jgi:hypothetical protein
VVVQLRFTAPLGAGYAATEWAGASAASMRTGGLQKSFPGSGQGVRSPDTLKLGDDLVAGDGADAGHLLGVVAHAQGQKLVVVEDGQVVLSVAGV